MSDTHTNEPFAQQADPKTATATTASGTDVDNNDEELVAVNNNNNNNADADAVSVPMENDPLDNTENALAMTINSSFDDHSFNLNHSFAVHEPIDLTWQDITLRAGDIEILHQVSGNICEGLVAIMGPSGSGKTSLLNCLACRIDPGTDLTGSFRINGEPYTTKTLKKFLGYVMQDDVHNPLLTVRETLEFVAEARLTHKTTAEERHKMITDALKSLSLLHCADVPVGAGNSGISGGEKKRLSVAVELLSQPKVLFLDEPTSNLDSLDALHFVKSMQNLVRETHCVVVCTIHQPQYRVFSQFDRLIMLRSGSIVYDGSVDGVRPFCEQAGSPCPSDANPADHMMEVIAPCLNDSFNTEERKRQKFESLYGEHEVDITRGLGRKNMRYMREGAPFANMLKMSFRRSVVLLGRRKTEFVINLLITILNSFLIGLVFLKIGTDNASQQKRLPALFFAVVNQASFGAISTVSVIPGERASVLRERASGNVSALSYFIGKICAEILAKLPFPIIFSVITYFLIGFQADGHHFFRYFAAICMSFMTGMTVAMLASAVARDGFFAALALPLFMEMSRLFGGYFIPLSQLPPGLRWINYISYIFYGFNSVAQNEMSDLVLSCAPTCSGGIQQQVLDQRGQYLSYDKSMGVLTCYFAMCAIGAYIAVRVLKQ